MRPDIPFSRCRRTLKWSGCSGCNVVTDCRCECADGWRREGQKTPRHSKNGRSGKKESGREGVPRRSEERTRIERKARPLEEHAIGLLERPSQFNCALARMICRH